MNVIEITSLQNELVKYAVKLQNPSFRKKEKKILSDGKKTILGFLDDEIAFEYLFVKKEDDVFEKFKNAKIENLVYITDDILKKISTTKTSSDIVCIIKEPEVNEEIFFNLDKIALIENIKDPGNLGTIIRSAAAFSIEGLILFGDCVDLYNPKTIRATTQNIFKIPIVNIKDVGFIEKLKKTHRLISTVVNSKNDFMNYDFSEKFILAFGSEAFGLSQKIENMSDDKLTIFMDNNVESINLGVCASIAFSVIKLKKDYR